MTEDYTKFLLIVIVYVIILYFLKRNKNLSQIRSDNPSVIVTNQAERHKNDIIETFPELEFNTPSISFYCICYELMILTKAAKALDISQEQTDKTVTEVIKDEKLIDKFYKEQSYFWEIQEKYPEHFYELIQTDIDGNCVTPDGFFDIRRKMKFILDEEKLHTSSFTRYKKALKNYYADELGASI